MRRAAPRSAGWSSSGSPTKQTLVKGNTEKLFSNYGLTIQWQEGQRLQGIVHAHWPSEILLNWIACVFRAYFDESWDQHQKKILTIGGMLGRYEEWSKIEWAWKALL